MHWIRCFLGRSDCIQWEANRDRLTGQSIRLTTLSGSWHENQATWRLPLAQSYELLSPFGILADFLKACIQNWQRSQLWFHRSFFFDSSPVCFLPGGGGGKGLRFVLPRIQVLRITHKSKTWKLNVIIVTVFSLRVNLYFYSDDSKQTTLLVALAASNKLRSPEKQTPLIERDNVPLVQSTLEMRNVGTRNDVAERSFGFKWSFFLHSSEVIWIIPPTGTLQLEEVNLRSWNPTFSPLPLFMHGPERNCKKNATQFYLQGFLNWIYANFFCSFTHYLCFFFCVVMGGFHPLSRRKPHQKRRRPRCNEAFTSSDQSLLQIGNTLLCFMEATIEATTEKCWMSLQMYQRSRDTLVLYCFSIKSMGIGWTLKCNS